MENSCKLPLISDRLDSLSLSSATLFDCVDLKIGFWQMGMKESDKEKNCFFQPRPYQFRVMPFGLTNAPSSFERHTKNVLIEQLEKCLLYLDDIIPGSTKPDSLQRTENGFQRL